MVPLHLVFAGRPGALKQWSSMTNSGASKGALQGKKNRDLWMLSGKTRLSTSLMSPFTSEHMTIHSVDHKKRWLLNAKPAPLALASALDEGSS